MNRRTKKRIRTIIILVLILALAATAIILYRYWNRTIFNDTLVYGNSGGNFYNGGLFCEANGIVYFANPSDNGRLYQMLPDGSQIEKLNDDSVHCINADSHYIYYARAKSGIPSGEAFSFLNFNTNSLCRVNLKGGRLEILDSAPTLYATLVENTIYYIHYDEETASTLYQVGIDGKDSHMVVKEPLLLSPGQEGTLCYSGVAEPGIFLLNPASNVGTAVYMQPAYYPIDYGNYIYFLNGENDYHLYRYDKIDGTVTELTDCRIDCYNLTNEYIYYQRNEKPALCRIRLDGTGEAETVMEGIFTGIHVTSRYVYFCDFHTTDSFYQTPADGPIDIQIFYPKSNSDN